jgi:hypothetical protein
VQSPDAPIVEVPAESHAAKIMVAILVGCPEPGTSKMNGFIGMLSTWRMVVRGSGRVLQFERMSSFHTRKGYTLKHVYEEGKAPGDLMIEWCTMGQELYSEQWLQIGGSADMLLE